MELPAIRSLSEFRAQRAGPPPRQRFLRRYEALKQERSSYLAHWRDILEHLLPRKLVLDGETPAQQGNKKHGRIVNGSGTKALRTLAAGMQSGITSPSRPWFRLEPPDMRLRNSARVRQWLDEVEELMRLSIARSNLYNCFHTVYADLGAIGTTALHIDEDMEDGIRGYVLPVGQYCLAASARRNVNTCYRETRFTAAQLVEQFGYDVLSERTQRAAREAPDTWVSVLHVIEPNNDYDGIRLDAASKPWRSAWYELGGGEYDKALRVSGFDEFPVMAPRWDATGDAVYGDSPAMDALGDVRALQKLERDKARAFAKVVDPPMTGPASLQAHRASLLPGDYTPADAVSAGSGYRPAMQVDHGALGEFRASIQEHEKRIREALFADTWLLISSAERGNMTATEVAQRSEEKMMLLGPVLERLQDEFLDPVVDRVFALLHRGGQLPPPPQELQGAPLRVEYISIMAQAQKALGISSVERLAGFGGNLIAVDPSVRHKFNLPRMVDEYAMALGTKSELVRTDEEAQALIDAEKEAAAAQAQGQAMATAAQGAKVLSETDMGGDSALNRLLGNMGAPTGEA